MTRRVNPADRKAAGEIIVPRQLFENQFGGERGGSGLTWEHEALPATRYKLVTFAGLF